MCLLDLCNGEPNGQSTTDYVLSLNLNRRHIKAGQRACLGLELKCKIALDGKPGVDAGEEAAKRVGVSRRYIFTVQKIRDKSESLYQRIRAGELSILQAEKELDSYGTRLKQFLKDSRADEVTDKVLNAYLLKLEQDDRWRFEHGGIMTEVTTVALALEFNDFLNSQSYRWQDLSEDEMNDAYMSWLKAAHPVHHERHVRQRIKGGTDVICTDPSCFLRYGPSGRCPFDPENLHPASPDTVYHFDRERLAWLVGEDYVRAAEAAVVASMNEQERNAIRIAPGFATATAEQVGPNGELPDKAYTVEALATFLGQTDENGKATDAFVDAFRANELIAAGRLTEEAIRTLDADGLKDAIREAVKE